MPKMKFRLKAGWHVGRDGKVVKPGAIVESMDNLATRYVNKFERVHADDPDVNTPATDSPAPKRRAAKGAKAEIAGTDVTTRFPKAVECGFKVYRRDNLYFVYDSDDMELVNEAGCDKATVDKVIESRLE